MTTLLTEMVVIKFKAIENVIRELCEVSYEVGETV
jgi:hypothetical protein